MQSVAFAPPVWAATLRSLRRLTRMAATALVLVVGLNGLTAPVTADPLGPVSTIRPPAHLQVSAAAPAGRSVAGSVDARPGRGATSVAWAAGAGASTADSAHRLPRATSTAPTTGVPARQADPDVATSPADAAAVVPAADPGRDPVARRGPPRA
ncbi:hypothetical protein ACGFI9_07580 [Micromonospora sp. NPDC048930]|uniref:hypothetical protein n=1 Tax=Micromonospora sp. NPDC048930 TaxID=3364261 RepID=UPI003720F85F